MFVLCAPEMPAVMVRSSRGFDVSILGRAGGLFGYQMGSEGICAHACHGQWMTALQLKRLYPKPPLRAPEGVTRPSDIFEYLTERPDDR